MLERDEIEREGTRGRMGKDEYDKDRTGIMVRPGCRQRHTGRKRSNVPFRRCKSSPALQRSPQTCSTKNVTCEYQKCEHTHKKANIYCIIDQMNT